MIRKFIQSERELFKVDYKPLRFRIFKHQNGALTLALARWRLKLWGWWK